MKLRALRRAHKERMKLKALLIYPYDPHGKLADNLKNCSCPNCGNPRRHYRKKTTAEYLHEYSAWEQDPTVCPKPRHVRW